MVAPNQQILPLNTAPRSSRRQPVGVATRVRDDQPVRWGAAVVDSVQNRQNYGWKEVGGAPRRARRTTVWVGEAPQRPATKPQPARPRPIQQLETAPRAAASTGESFAQNRIRHAFELFGACMMIVTFLAFAMFA